MNYLKLFAVVYGVFILVLVAGTAYAVYITTKAPTTNPQKQVTCVVELHQENELHEWHGVIK